MQKPHFKVELNEQHLLIKDINTYDDWIHKEPFCKWIKKIKSEFPNLGIAYNCVLHGGGPWISVYNGTVSEYKYILNEIVRGK